MTTINNYIASFEDEQIQSRLSSIKELVEESVPDALGGIAYGLAGFKYKKKPLVYFGGFKNHIGFYATPSANQHFQNKLSEYKQGKGSIQFPNDKELPLQLMKQMILFKKKEIDDPK